MFTQHLEKAQTTKSFWKLSSLELLCTTKYCWEKNGDKWDLSSVTVCILVCLELQEFKTMNSIMIIKVANNSVWRSAFINLYNTGTIIYSVHSQLVNPRFIKSLLPVCLDEPINFANSTPHNISLNHWTQFLGPKLLTQS